MSLNSGISGYTLKNYEIYCIFGHDRHIIFLGLISVACLQACLLLKKHLKEEVFQTFKRVSRKQMRNSYYEPFFEKKRLVVHSYLNLVVKCNFFCFLYHSEFCLKCPKGY